MSDQSTPETVNISPDEPPTDAVTDEVKRSEVEETGQLDDAEHVTTDDVDSAADDLAEVQTEGPDET